MPTCKVSRRRTRHLRHLPAKLNDLSAETRSDILNKLRTSVLCWNCLLANIMYQAVVLLSAWRSFMLQLWSVRMYAESLDKLWMNLCLRHIVKVVMWLLCGVTYSWSSSSACSCFDAGTCMCTQCCNPIADKIQEPTISASCFRHLLRMYLFAWY